jgi:hypothetical protein
VVVDVNDNEEHSGDEQTRSCRQVQQERCLPRGLAGKPRPARSDRAKTRI